MVRYYPTISFRQSVREGRRVIKKAVVWILGFGMLWVVFLYFFRPQTYYGILYGILYGTDEKNVSYIPKPHDCDFDKAPQGNKECHFERRVNVEAALANNPVKVTVTWEKVQERSD
jgi:hypothetical protein